jgi:hypothetical protein
VEPILSATDDLLVPETDPLPTVRLDETDADWLCGWCLNHVASDRQRFLYGGKNEFFFRNPNGIPFGIITFAETLSCRETGTPTLEHTWFPGYAWSYCHCDRCGEHLGWCYSGPQVFYGLIKARLKRADLVLN